MEYVNLVINQIIIFIIYALIGIIAIKKNILSEHGLTYISNLVIKITLPIMLFYNTVSGVTKEDFFNSLSVLYLTILFYFLLILVSFILKKIFKLKKDQGNVYMASTMFGNVGFIGIPIISTLFPEKGMLYIALFTIVDQLLLWTLGVELTTKTDSNNKFDLKGLLKMINPSTVAIVLAVIVVMLDIQLPTTLATALSRIGNVTSPLAMIYLGGVFCFIDAFYYFKRIEFYGSVIIKMLIMPLIFFFAITNLTSIDTNIITTLTILMAMPTMSSIAMLAKSQDCYGDYSLGCVLVTTIACIITIPLVCFLITLI